MKTHILILTLQYFTGGNAVYIIPTDDCQRLHYRIAMRPEIRPFIVEGRTDFECELNPGYTEPTRISKVKRHDL